MGEQIEAKEGEQYPLLRNDTGGGDSNAHFLQQPPHEVTSICNITRTPKRSWLDRWPEFFSACWITLILIGISFLAFYTLGVNVYRRQPLLITKCNGSTQANTLFFHQIIPSGAYVPFMTYSDYVSDVAMQYPFLNIHVVFLLDDSIPNAASLKHVKLLKRLTQPLYTTYDASFDQTNKKEIVNVEKKHPNVNITIMPLSKYMAMTPQRFKWRSIPVEYLSFYVRLFAVWQYGGVAMDLSTFNNIFSLHKHPDCRISHVLKQHNDGVNGVKYLNALKTLNQKEQNEMFTMMYLLVNHLVNETNSLLTRSLWPNDSNSEVNLWLESSLLEPKRKRRDSMPNEVKGETDLYSIVMNKTIPNVVVMNRTESVTDSQQQLISNHTVLENELKHNSEHSMNTASTEETPILLLNNTNHTNSELKVVFNSSGNASEVPPIYFFYDVAIVSDNFPMRPEPMNAPRHSKKSEVMVDNFHLYDHLSTNVPVLTISPDGAFVAAPSRHHPFLENLVSTRYEGVSPTYVVNRALMKYCTGFFKSEMYCENIFVL